MMIHCKHIFYYKSISRFYSSALYITGDKAQKTYVVLNPVIDFEKRLTKQDELVKNITARGLPINIESVTKKWAFFEELLKRKHTLELTKQDIAQNISRLLKGSDVVQEEVDKFKLHSKVVKDDLKNLKDSFYDIEETTMLQILGLPNVLHNKTPLDDENIILTHLETPKGKTPTNIDIGICNGYVKYVDPFTCYLKSDAALLELSTLEYFRKMLLKNSYLQFSNPNFCRTIIAEGCEEICCGSEKVLTLEEKDHDENNFNKLHLCGSGTLKSFMAYFARHVINQVALPLKYFSLGRVYQPVKKDDVPSLFNLTQQTAVNIFWADLEEKSEDIQSVVDLISDIYSVLGFHYRIVILPASEIEKAESLRMSIQMFSNFQQEYVEVGNVSFYDTYVSKRLLFTYSSNKEKKYPKIISGQILNFHKFIGCAFENFHSENEPLLNVCLREKVIELNNK